MTALLFRILALFSCAIFLYGCSMHSSKDGPPRYGVDVSRIKNPKPKKEPLSKYGNPRSYVVRGHRYHVLKTSEGYTAKGVASWYGTKFHGNHTSSGTEYNLKDMTAAHKSLPIPTYVQVRNLRNNKTVIVKVNDRGPFVGNRLIDLSYAAARKLGVTGTGTAPVEITALPPYQYFAQGQAPAHTYHANNVVQYLQVGVFSDKQNALNMVQKIKQLSLRTHVQMNAVQQSNRHLYKVKVGPLDTEYRKTEIISSLEQAGIHQSWTVTQ